MRKVFGLQFVTIPLEKFYFTRIELIPKKTLNSFESSSSLNSEFNFLDKQKKIIGGIEIVIEGIN